MKVGVLSDTHLADPAIGRCLVDRLLDTCFADVDLVLHAGDVGSPELLFYFAPLNVQAVGGNTDLPHRDLPASRTLTIDGLRVVLAHGWGSNSGLERRLQAHFNDLRPDVLIFGHSHAPVCRKVGGLLLFNPGSPTRPRTSAGPTVGLLDFQCGQATGRIVSCPSLLDEDMP